MRYDTGCHESPREIPWRLYPRKLLIIISIAFIAVTFAHKPVAEPIRPLGSMPVIPGHENLVNQRSYMPIHRQLGDDNGAQVTSMPNIPGFPNLIRAIEHTPREPRWLRHNDTPPNNSWPWFRENGLEKNRRGKK